MASYRYIDRADKDRKVTLGEVEALGAKSVGIEFKPSSDGMSYMPHEHLASEIGFAILMRGGYNIGEWKPGRAKDVMISPRNEQDVCDQAGIVTITDAIFTKYDFEAWR